MDHPARGTANKRWSETLFRHCTPERRCGICAMLVERPRSERALFEAVVWGDGDLADALGKLLGLFYDAAA